MGRKFLVLVLSGIPVTVVFLFSKSRWFAVFNAPEASLAVTKESAINSTTTELAMSMTELAMSTTELAMSTSTTTTKDTTTVVSTSTTTTKDTTTQVSTSTTTNDEPFEGIIHNSPHDNYVPFFNNSDFQKFQSWSGRREHEKHNFPRVLMITWCTEDIFETFHYEVYWKECYAHAHGFDLLFTSVMNLTGVAVWNGTADLSGVNDKWYSDENMWAWVPLVQKYLRSGDYDYVFHMGGDVFILPINLEWPVWAWDRGHDIIIMDDHKNPPPYSYGFNQNNILFKASNFSLRFLSEFFEYRKGFHLQGDNGPYMESLLNFLGYEAEANGKAGYDKKCSQWLKLPAPNAHMAKYEFPAYKIKQDAYDECFYQELERLTGPYGHRKSRNIGFSPTYFWNGSLYLPSAFSGAERPIGPWGNCWSNSRRTWTDVHLNCFAYHWNGPKDEPVFLRHRASVYENQGLCPDPTFNWDASPYNAGNRKPKKQQG